MKIKDKVGKVVAEELINSNSNITKEDIANNKFNAYQLAVLYALDTYNINDLEEIYKSEITFDTHFNDITGEDSAYDFVNEAIGEDVENYVNCGCDSYEDMLSTLSYAMEDYNAAIDNLSWVIDNIVGE